MGAKKSRHESVTPCILRVLSESSAFITPMFFVGYLRSELVRRKSRTILTVLGLALGVSLVIAVSALSRGLDDAQATALDPLSSIGTDLTVTLAPEQDTGGQGGGFGGGGGGFGGGGREVIQANQSVITDLSKLGKPGDNFVHDFFLPGTQLTFPQSSAKQIAQLAGRRRRLERARPGRGPPGGNGAEDRRQDQDRRPAAPASTSESSLRPRPSSRRCRPASRRPGITVGGAPGGGRPARRAAGRPRRRRSGPRWPAATAGRSPSACRPASSASAPRSRRRSRRSGRSSTRRRRTSRARAYTIAGVDPATPGDRRRHPGARLERPFPRREHGRARGARRRRLREPPGPEGRIEARPERHELHGRRARAAAARRPDRRRLRPARRAAEAREPEGRRQRRCSSAPRAAPPSARCSSRSRSSSRGREVASAQAGRRLDQRLPRRRVEPLRTSRHRSRRSRRRRRVPARHPPDPRVGRQARARDRDAEGARLDAGARRPPDRRRVGRARAPRRPPRRRRSASSSRSRSARSGRR